MQRTSHSQHQAIAKLERFARLVIPDAIAELLHLTRPINIL
jgi:hypothetical protein